MSHSPSTLPHRSFVIAHRAGNCLDALRDAADLGTPLIEADVQWFRGTAVVRHIKHVGPLPLYWDKWELAHPSREFPTLQALLDAAPAGAELMLDLKGRSRKLAATVREALLQRPTLGRVTVCARAWRLLDAFGDLASVRCVRSVGSKRGLDRFLRAGRSAAAGGTGISIHRRLLGRDVVRQLRDTTDLVMSWPVNDVPTARVLEDWGVHGLISDVPATLLDAMSVADDGAGRERMAVPA